MDSSQTVALAIFASYFLVIFATFSLIFSSLPRKEWSSRAIIHLLIGTGALAHTWFYMITYLLWSFRDYEAGHQGAQTAPTPERVANWLVSTELFEQAWFTVCNGPYKWWWSEQLCLFTVGVWTVFLAIEGRRHDVKHVWAYMLLGQLVAISVATNLFFSSIALSGTPPPPRRNAKASIILTTCVVVALVSVALVPHLEAQDFLKNLLLMHGAAMIPLLPLWTDVYPLSCNASVLYAVIAIAGAGIRLRTMFATPRGDFLINVWDGLTSHPASSSIGWDIVWTTASWCVYSVLEGGFGLVDATLPLMSIGVTPAITLAYEAR